MKSMIVIGGGPEQCPIIERLQQQGYLVILFDGNPQAKGSGLANYFHAVSTRDFNSIINVLHTEYSSFELTGCTYMITESCLESVYRVAKVFNMSATSFESVRCTQSKTYLREFLSEHKLNNVPFRKVKSSKELDQNFFQQYPKTIVKPTDSGGQVGLHIIDRSSNPQELIDDALALSFSGECIIEQFIDGDEINGVFIVLNGKVKNLVISDRLHEDKVFGVVKQHRYPSVYESLSSNIAAYCQKLIDALKINNGIFFPQFLVNKKAFYLCEIGERIPGGIMMELYQYATGIDLLDLQIDISANQVKPINDYRKHTVTAAVVVDFHNCVKDKMILPCLVEKVVGFDYEQLSGLSYEYGFYSFSNQGTPQARKLKVGGDRFFYSVLGGDSLHEIDLKLATIKPNLKFETDQGVIFSC